MQAVPSTSTSTAKPSATTNINTVTTHISTVKSAAKAVKTPTHNHPHPHTQPHTQHALHPQQQHTGAAITGVSDPKNEIEEISKKISEHADAIYHTWKSRGLAPTELLEFYTHAAAADTGGAGDLFAAATDSTAEGLQQLVNTFVIKDKEQRAAGVKTKSPKSPTLLTPDAELSAQSKNMAGKLKQSATKTATAQQKVTASAANTSVKNSTSSGILLKAGEVGRDGADVVDTLKKKIAKTSAGAKSTSSATATATATAKTATPVATTAKALTSGLKDNACVKVSAGVQQQKQKPSTGNTQVSNQTSQSEQTVAKTSGKAHSGEVTGSVAATTATTATKTRITSLNKSKASAVTRSPLTLDINLNLDVNDLSELQTHNLRKIKELLLQENANTTTAASTKTGTGTATATAAADSAKVKKPQTHAKLEAETRGASTAATTLVTNHAQRQVNTAKSRTELAAKSSSTLGGEHSGGGENDKNSSNSSNRSDSHNHSHSQSQSKSNSTANNSGSNQSGAQLKRSTAMKVSTKLGVHDNLQATSQSQQTTQSQQQLPQSTQQLPSGSNIKAKDSEKTAPRIISGQPISNGTGKAIKVTIKEDNNNNNSTSNKAPTKKDSKAAGVAAGGVGTEQPMEVGRSNMPAAPTKFIKSSRPLVNGQDKNLGRPILTRGSVAERVMMFEKCPDVRNSFLNIKRPDPADAPPKSLLKVKLHATPPQPQEQNSLQKEFRSNKSVYIPRFYFPHGKPQPTIALERTLRGILSAFDSFPNNQVTKDELPRILKLCGIPFYWRMPVMIFCQQGNSGLVERQRFVEFWKQMNVYCHDNASRFVYILSRGQRFRSYILPEDMAPLVQDVVDTHPGLAFLKEATEFHSRYVHTVIARIFYTVNRSWSGKITISELKKSDLLEIISLLEEEDDINQIMAFFSYEHFYVIYCKFWELDKDHDLLINQDDLARHSDHALSTRIVERIFSGCVTRSDNKKNPDDEPKMSYTDFVWFLLSEEDKRTPTAIEYWFRCMDIDGDGVLSMYELEYFYEEQQQRMESIGIETLPFEDCLCQMLDMIKPARRDCVTLGDLKRCRMTHVFFDTFFNLEKYLDHEQRDPFASQRDEYASDWDRFAAQEYELLISEENE